MRYLDRSCDMLFCHNGTLMLTYEFTKFNINSVPVGQKGRFVCKITWYSWLFPRGKLLQSKLPPFICPPLSPPAIQSREREAVLQDQEGAMGGMVMSNSQNAEECRHSTRCLSAITGLVSTTKLYNILLRSRLSPHIRDNVLQGGHFASKQSACLGWTVHFEVVSGPVY